MKRFFLVLLAILMLVPSGVLAAENACGGGLVPCGPGRPKPVCELCDFFTMIAKIVNCLLFGIVPALAAVMIAIAGVMFIISFSPEGGPEMANRAKKLLSSIIIGILIIYGAWLIVDTILFFLGANEGMLGNWWQIKC